ncbi:serine palmitoyltransferase small subunit A [Monomorium pharaonis]|uniref:serine palmitoyltransferase small subunit A n=1 Tax=Monomorium pharaonis TaxID=307658 RepID=UPI00102E1689|nr:serine palmitoyltransferase small subunit A [Monomorium pharaonis]
MDVIRNLQSFLKYWYFRYSLITELYMVEEWERNFINIFLLILFSLFFVFNYKGLLPITQYVLGNL